MSKGSNTLNQQAAKPSRSVLFGAAFLMATSAIGPGFLTQTSKFTAQFGTALSLVIVLAIIMDITAQMNIWSVVSVSGMRAQDVANKLLPGLGVVIAILVAIGGLAFNVGNVGGVALGFNAMFGLNEKIGAVIAGCLGIIIFVNKNAKTIMDKVATVLAAVILLTVATVAVISKPPVGEAVSSLAQLGNLGNKDLLLALTTLLGGSCAGYTASPARTACWTPESPALRILFMCAGASCRAAHLRPGPYPACSWQCWHSSMFSAMPPPSSPPETPPPRPSAWPPETSATACSACACSPPGSPPW